MLIKVIFALAASTATTADLPKPAEPASIMIVNDEASVAGCQFLGEVKGSSAWGGVVTNMAYNRARDGLRKKALELGATHVVLLDSSSGPMGSNILGNAYRCQVKTG